MHVRSSRVLDKLRAGGVVSCFKLNFGCARLAELAAMLGFDCIWTDLEHTANDWSVVEKQIWAAKTQNVDVIVRVPRGSYSDYIRPLELDAAGIMVPHIMSAEDARQVVRMTRFHPLGRRPIDGGNADGAYCIVSVQDYVRESNERKFVVVQVEDPEPMDEIEAIASLEGIDMLFFGPGDFSHGIGVPGDYSHPKVSEARRRVAEVCRANGKYAGTVGGPDNLDELIDMGYRFINMGADVRGLSVYCSSLVDVFARAQAKLAGSSPAE